ncbi:MAG: hypothetical protein C0392_00480 [Syntrophus sp. (in: bacteria)]|nr:hypothetical protein [Syntrophus sp. (in: bacteria)]
MRTILWIIILTLSLCVAVIVEAAPATPSSATPSIAGKTGKDNVASKDSETKKFNVGDFSFSSENRRDPFEPLYLTKIKRDKDHAGKARKEGYELEELKFVGTIKKDMNRVAMMEDMQGRGMLFKKGDRLNSNLWVVDVVEDRLILGYKLRNEVKKINIDIPKK